MLRYDKYVWYYEYLKEIDNDAKNKWLNQFKVIRFEAKTNDDLKIIKELEQNYYDFKRKCFKLFLFSSSILIFKKMFISVKYLG